MIVVASSNPLLTSCGELGTRHNAGRPDWRFRQREPIETQHESKRSFEAPLQYVIVQKRPNRLLSQHISLGAVAVILPFVAVFHLTLRSSFGRLDDAHRHLADMDRLYVSTIETLAMAI